MKMTRHAVKRFHERFKGLIVIDEWDSAAARRITKKMRTVIDEHRSKAKCDNRDMRYRVSVNGVVFVATLEDVVLTVIRADLIPKWRW